MTEQQLVQAVNDLCPRLRPHKGELVREHTVTVDGYSVIVNNVAMGYTICGSKGWTCENDLAKAIYVTIRINGKEPDYLDERFYDKHLGWIRRISHH